MVKLSAAIVVFSSEFLPDCRNVHIIEHIDKRVDHPIDTNIEIVTGNVLKEFTQKGIRQRNQFRRSLPGEDRVRFIVQFCGEHALGNGLSVNVRKLFGLNIVEQHFAETL